MRGHRALRWPGYGGDPPEARNRYNRLVYRLLAFALISMLADAAEITIDHVSVAGRDVKAMQAKLAAAGIPSAYGGPHKNHATEMALTSFPDGSYLELIALQSNADPATVAAHTWSKKLQEDGGPCAWAARTKDMGAELKRLQAAGITVSMPERAGRQRPDGVKLEWETAQVGAEPNGTFFPFLIHDFTPREARAFPSGKPLVKNVTGVLRIVIAVRNLDEATKRYRAAYNLTDPIKQVDQSFGAHLALLGNTPVVLAAPLNAESWLNDRIERFGEGPCAFVLGAKPSAHYFAASKTRWFGTDISWSDTEKLGWRLGFQSVP